MPIGLSPLLPFAEGVGGVTGHSFWPLPPAGVWCVALVELDGGGRRALGIKVKGQITQITMVEGLLSAAPPKGSTEQERTEYAPQAMSWPPLIIPPIWSLSACKTPSSCLLHHSPPTRQKSKNALKIRGVTRCQGVGGVRAFLMGMLVLPPSRPLAACTPQGTHPLIPSPCPSPIPSPSPIPPSPPRVQDIAETVS